MPTKAPTNLRDTSILAQRLKITAAKLTNMTAVMTSTIRLPDVNVTISEENFEERSYISACFAAERVGEKARYTIAAGRNGAAPIRRFERLGRPASRHAVRDLCSS